jgi:hypothetical protein
MGSVNEGRLAEASRRGSVHVAGHRLDVDTAFAAPRDPEPDAENRWAQDQHVPATDLGSSPAPIRPNVESPRLLNQSETCDGVPSGNPTYFYSLTIRRQQCVHGTCLNSDRA